MRKFKMVQRSSRAMEILNDFNYCTEESRLETFTNWPHKNKKCSPLKMAQSGFFCPDQKYPDLAKCFVCDKELDGWESEDDPWEEHKSHSPQCPFIIADKKENEMTVDDFITLNYERSILRIKKEIEGQKKDLIEKRETMRKKMENLL